MVHSFASPLVGSTLGRYQVIRRIGAGGMGVVYEALNPERNLTVALKTLNHLDADAIYRLKNEFRSLAGVAHPNLVKMHELSCVGEHWFFVMDYVLGVPFVDHFLGSRIRFGNDSESTVDVGVQSSAPTFPSPAPTFTDEPFGQANSDRRPAPRSQFYPRLKQGLAQLIDGINALHALGKIHRDIKPSNVLITPEGRVVILDFGLTSDTQPTPDRSAEQGISGTPLYMAPETFNGEPVSPATDWYAVGVILYEVLTSRLPFRGAVHQLMSLKLFSDPQAPAELVPETPAELNAICLRLLSRNFGARPSGQELAELFPVQALRGQVPASELPPARGPFVGRKHELSVLKSALERVAADKTVILSISGESGIGKSALVEAFLHDLRNERDLTVLSGRCYEHESVPYKAFDQIADALSRFLNRAGDTEAALVMPREPAALTILFPVLARVPVVQGSTGRRLPADPMELRLLGFAAFRELLCRLSDRRPLVLVVDDLQWSDADSAVLFKEVFGGQKPPASLLITTSRQPRPEALHGLLSALDTAGEDSVELVELELGGLSEQESTELASQVGLAVAERRAAVATITAEAKGNPFFVVALARNAAESPRAGASLRSFMRSWVGTLPEGAAELLKVIAVAGRPVNEAAVLAVVEAQSAVGYLAFLAAQHFIGAWPTPSRLVECYHDQIRDAVIAALTAAELRSLHARLAHVLEATAGVDARQLAVHFLASGESVRGSVYAERAADEALRALAFLEAAQWYERALKHVDADPERARALQTKLGEAFAGAGRGAAAAQWFLAAAGTAPLETALKLRQRAAELLLVSGHIAEGVRVLGDVLGHFHMRLAPTPRRALANLLWQRGRVAARGLRFVERGEDQLSESELLRIDACWSVALGLSLVDTIRAADFQTRNLLLSLGSGEPYRIARALAMEAAVRATGGARTERNAKELSDAASALAERVGNPHAIGLTTFMAGFLHYLVGRWRASCPLLSRAEEIFLDQPGAIWELNAAQRFLLNSLTYVGDIPAVARKVPELVKRARERGNLYAECYLRVRLCCLLSLAKDDPEGAIAETVDVMQRWSQDGFHLQHYNELFAHVNCALYQGRAKEALARIEATWPKLQGSLLTRTQAVRVEAYQLRTRVCLSYLQHVGQESKVKRILEGDIRKMRAEDVPWARAFASFAQGLYHAALAEPERAEQWLERAEQELSDGDMHLFAAATRWRLGQVRGGDSGKLLISDARAKLSSHQITNPERFLGHYAPGL